jgi:hypothetical protein
MASLEDMYYGATMHNIKAALWLIFYGSLTDLKLPIEEIEAKVEACKTVIPKRPEFLNPFTEQEGNVYNLENLNDSTYVLYWINRDRHLTEDSYLYPRDYLTPKELADFALHDKEKIKAYNQNRCVADIGLRFIGLNAEYYAKMLRHLNKSEKAQKAFAFFCNGEKIDLTRHISTSVVGFYGKATQLAFDTGIKVYYNELVDTGWKLLGDVDLQVSGNIIDNHIGG